MKIAIHTAVSDTLKGGLSITVALTKQSAIDSLTADHQELIEPHGGQDELFDAAANGKHSNITQLNLDTTTFDLMDLIAANIEEPEEKPYLFKIRTLYEGYAEDEVYLSYTSNPVEKGKELAKDARELEESDWDESDQAYSFNGNLVSCNTYREITPAQAEVWRMAKRFEMGFF